jgi:hypothetical protein
MRFCLLLCLALPACDGAANTVEPATKLSPPGKADGVSEDLFSLTPDEPVKRLAIDCDEWWSCDLEVALKYTPSGTPDDPSWTQFPRPVVVVSVFPIYDREFTLYDFGDGTLRPIVLHTDDPDEKLIIEIKRLAWPAGLDELAMDATVSTW